MARVDALARGNNSTWRRVETDPSIPTAVQLLAGTTNDLKRFLEVMISYSPLPISHLLFSLCFSFLYFSFLFFSFSFHINNSTRNGRRKDWWPQNGISILGVPVSMSLEQVDFNCTPILSLSRYSGLGCAMMKRIMKVNKFISILRSTRVFYLHLFEDSK
jgi:hypothetical protein